MIKIRSEPCDNCDGRGYLIYKSWYKTMSGTAGEEKHEPCKKCNGTGWIPKQRIEELYKEER